MLKRVNVSKLTLATSSRLESHQGVGSLGGGKAFGTAAEEPDTADC